MPDVARTVKVTKIQAGMRKAMRISRRGFLILASTATLAAVGGATWRAYSAEIARARGRVLTGSTVIQTRFGPTEYATAGSGPPCLMIHGTGGGFDQGLAFGAPLVAAGWTVIAPSRFGYLRSAFPEDPSPENQADAFVDLMDQLGIGRAPVIGGSAGALSAMQFAIRHPDRCSALVAIVPAAYAPDHPPAQPPNAIARAIIEHGLRSDLLFWLGLVAAEDAMIGALLATDAALVHGAELDEQARVSSILRNIQPVSLRVEGLLNDGTRSGNPQPMALDRIVAPTLVASVEDDRFETAAAARHIAVSVSGAELVMYPSGGHVWVGRNIDLFARIDAFMRKADPAAFATK